MSSEPSTGAAGASVPSARFLELVAHDFARDHLVISRGEVDGREVLAVSEQTSALVPFNIGVRLGAPITVVTLAADAIARAIDDAYGALARSDVETGEGSGERAGREVLEVEQLIAQMQTDLLSTQGKGPIIKLVDALLFEAIRLHASDIHLQPVADQALVRYRVDGALHTARQLPKKIAVAAISRIKVMGRMDIAERRVAQDGRATVGIGDRRIDLRISTFPTSYGERVVLRLLDNSQRLCDFEALGMPVEVAERFLECASRPHGIVLVTGPTGSGKTTTLYATLQRTASADLNVMTIEDPIEYDLATLGVAISQAQVNLKKGVSFATGLRHILRQDPDVILVGEIRDQETARMAIQSSLTGHLVFATLHTNDACSALARLIDLGVEPYLVASSLSAILAQRLVRLVHEPCVGRGCDECFDRGLKGRTGLFELLVINERLQSLITQRASLAELRAAAGAAGMRTLREDGERLIATGRAKRAEVARVIQAEGEA